MPHVAVALQSGELAVTAEMVHETGGAVLFGGEFDIDLWDVRVRRGLARLELRRWEPAKKSRAATLTIQREAQNLVLPLALVGKRARPLDDRLQVEPGDSLAWLLFTDREREAGEWLDANGWRAAS